MNRTDIKPQKLLELDTIIVWRQEFLRVCVQSSAGFSTCFALFWFCIILQLQNVNFTLDFMPGSPLSGICCSNCHRFLWCNLHRVERNNFSGALQRFRWSWLSIRWGDSFPLLYGTKCVCRYAQPINVAFRVTWVLEGTPLPSFSNWLPEMPSQACPYFRFLA